MNLKETSGGHPNIPAKVFKISADIISSPLLTIINRCIETGNFPECLKIAKVVPLFKAKNRRDVKNFRPISLLPIIAKIFEKHIYNQLNYFVEMNQILCKQQAGFRKNSSTCISIAKLLNGIISGVEDGRYGLCVFLDLQKAFDMIDHDILLKKLYFYGVRGTELRLFYNYLSNRKQFVEINSVSSGFCDICRGVPQGSVLSALLFILFINDIVNSSNKLFFNLFADDTSIYYKNKNVDDLYRTMNEELNKVGIWLGANKLSLNVNKTIYILFKGKKKLIDVPNLYMYGSPISRNENTKFLGIFIDEHLSWKPHAKFIIGKLSRTIGIIRKTHENLNLHSLKTLYFSFVQPCLQYGIIFWFSVSSDLRNKIFRLQKKAIRLINKTNFDSHSEPLFFKNKILKFEDLFKLESCKFIHQEINFCNNFELVSHSNIHRYSTRFNQNLVPHRPKTRAGSNFVLSQGVNMYNLLPETFKNLDTMSKFKCYLNETGSVICIYVI